MSHCPYCGIDNESQAHDDEEHRMLQEQDDVNRFCNAVRAEAEQVLTPAELDVASQAAMRDAYMPIDVIDNPFAQWLTAQGLAGGGGSVSWRVYAESLRRRTATIIAARNEATA